MRSIDSSQRCVVVAGTSRAYERTQEENGRLWAPWTFVEISGNLAWNKAAGFVVTIEIGCPREMQKSCITWGESKISRRFFLVNKPLIHSYPFKFSVVCHGSHKQHIRQTLRSLPIDPVWPPRYVNALWHSWLWCFLERWPTLDLCLGFSQYGLATDKWHIGNPAITESNCTTCVYIFIYILFAIAESRILGTCGRSLQGINSSKFLDI